MLSTTGRIIRKVLFGVANQGIVAMAIVMMLLVFLVVVDVTMRRGFNNPLGYSLELMGLGLVIIAWGTILYSTGKERHISVDVLVMYLPAKIRRFLRLTWDFVSVLVLFLIGWRSIIHALNQLDIGRESQLLEIPVFPFVFVVAFGAIWAGLMLLVNFIDGIRNKGEP